MGEDVRRIVNEKIVIKRYGKTDWNKLHSAIKKVLIDLRYRGDYKIETRRIIQKAVVDNDLKKFTALMANQKNWKSVPKFRFEGRVNV